MGDAKDDADPPNKDIVLGSEGQTEARVYVETSLIDNSARPTLEMDRVQVTDPRHMKTMPSKAKVDPPKSGPEEHAGIPATVRMPETAPEVAEIKARYGILDTTEKRRPPSRRLAIYVAAALVGLVVVGVLAFRLLSREPDGADRPLMGPAPTTPVVTLKPDPVRVSAPAPVPSATAARPPQRPHIPAAPSGAATTPSAAPTSHRLFGVED